jgi:urate oxidase
VVRWRYEGTDVDWDGSHAAIKALLLEQFADIHSLALQQTLHGMGKAVLERHPEVAEVRFSAPNKHHFLVDLTPFGVDNPNEVFHAADRPYGLIEASVVRDDASDPGAAWYGVPGWV